MGTTLAHPAAPGVSDVRRNADGSMSQDKPPEDSKGRYAVPEQQRKAARKWFEQARKLVEQRNYDYGIRSFLEGLALDPTAVEEGYMPLRGVAMARWQSGGKKPGVMDSMKYSMTGKDPVKAMLNAARLMAHDPANANYAEGVLRNANKAHCDEVLLWIGPIYRELLGNDKKPASKKFTALKEVYEELGDRCQARGEVAEAMKSYELGIEALTAQKGVDPQNRELDGVIRDLATKLTILRGNYQTADNFRDSVRDSGEQARLHDEDRLVQSEERLEELVEQARRDMEANPAVEAKVIGYVDLVCRVERDENENEAIALLMRKYEELGTYRFKQKADDIAIRQVGRHARQAKAAGQADKAKELYRRRVRLEEKVYKERVIKYPTDLRTKHEYAKRLFMVRKFDEAIPLLQQARADPKVRYSCMLHLGRCFFEKGFFSQAAGTLEEARGTYELTEDDVAKELNYWLARSAEGEGRTADAIDTYGKLLQIDYNYRDVRDRLEKLKQKDSGGP